MTVELPDSAVELLRQLTGDSDRVQWAIGDVAAALVDELGGLYGKAPVRARIAVETGLAPETVRDREGMARFYPEAIRDEYQVLGYHQLRACKAARDEWRHYADWAIRSADEYGGRPAPVTAIRGKIKNGGDATPAWEKRWDRLIELLELIAVDELAGKAERRLCRWCLSIAKNKGMI